VDPERSHLSYRACLISGRGERQGAYIIGNITLQLFGIVLDIALVTAFSNF
jgi:hypothetical protein